MTTPKKKLGPTNFLGSDRRSGVPACVLDPSGPHEGVPCAQGCETFSPGRVPSSMLRDLIADAGLTHDQAAAFLGRSRRTFFRWLQFGAPPWVVEPLRLRAGWLDQFGWSGWRIRKGRLSSIHWREGFTSADLYGLWYERQGMGYARDYRCRNDTANEEG